MEPTSIKSYQMVHQSILQRNSQTTLFAYGRKVLGSEHTLEDQLFVDATKRDIVLHENSDFYYGPLHMVCFGCGEPAMFHRFPNELIYPFFLLIEQYLCTPQTMSLASSVTFSQHYLTLTFHTLISAESCLRLLTERCLAAFQWGHPDPSNFNNITTHISSQNSPCKQLFCFSWQRSFKILDKMQYRH